MQFRPELFHPFFVHFPIALIVVAFVFSVGVLWNWREWWQWNTKLVLYAALIFLGFALFTGDFAEDVVKRNLCDVKVLHEHEEHAYQTLYILLGALFAETISWWAIKKKKSWARISYIFLMLLLLAANVSLFFTGHYGAELVYEQGAAVRGQNSCATYTGK